MLQVYGHEVSYFTGKFEAYLRYKEIPYELHPLTALQLNFKVKRHTGVAQMPAAELPDGRWMTDTTPMIAWLEAEHPDPAVIPTDPITRFFSLLVEDYADEWMWRPALHYRWDYPGDADLLSRRIAGMMGVIPLPPAAKRAFIRARQRRVYTRGDGITAQNLPHVEGIYLNTLDHLEAIFAEQPFLLGDRPTIADFGFFGSMFRHFSSDPTPAEIMRRRAPGVYEWVARMWNARASRMAGEVASSVPANWSPILREVGRAYLPYLVANVQAWKAKKKFFDVTIQGTAYKHCRTSRYRVWCLERLHAHHDAIPEPLRPEVKDLMKKHACVEPFWRAAPIRSGIDPKGQAPFARGAALLG